MDTSYLAIHSPWSSESTYFKTWRKKAAIDVRRMGGACSSSSNRAMDDVDYKDDPTGMKIDGTL